MGKGFPGGKYPASRTLATFPLDKLKQFGALVTNGHEELASLTYLVTIAFAEANGAYIREIGDHFELELRRVAKQNPEIAECIEGSRYLSSVFSYSVKRAIRFARRLTEGGVDISVQTYKGDCPPAVLTKIPLISTHRIVDLVVSRMVDALKTA